jgi:replicative DNA helicase
MSEKNFGQLGPTFQKSLIKVIIEDKKFAVTIIDVIESKYFDGPYFRYIIENVKEMYSKYGEIPSYDTVGQKIMSENTKDTTTSIHIDTLKNIRDHELTDEGWIKDTAMNFCKQQVLKKELKLVEKIIENGDFEEYRKIEKIIQNALQVGASSDDIRDVFENIAGALEKDSRLPVPLGVTGLDNLLKGGLGVGELGVILAPTGTGKTTFLTKIANTAYNQGKNVLQIFFEDNVTNILRKHYTIWTGIAPDDQIERKEEVIELVKQKESESTGKIKLLKMPSDSVTISEIKSKLRKLHSEGFSVDVLVIDYIDCISPEKSNFGEEWKGEGNVMRSLEAMTSEFNLVIWTATQGNRESISSEVVTTDQMGGSIKKAQIGHVVVSIAKTLEQKEHNLATITLLKSRIGRDGVIFQNCKFNNEYLDIDTDSQNTLLGFEEQKTQERANRAAEVFKKSQEKKGITLTNQ